MRPDLLALTIDDLIVLSNRGLVNRSQKDLDAGTVTATIVTEESGTISIQWSDGVTCQLPHNRPIAEDCCTCSATGICRHLIRSILAYQGSVPPSVELDGESSATVSAISATPSETIVTGSDLSDLTPDVVPALPQKTIVWDPGEIPDTLLEPYFKPAEWQRLQNCYAQGQVIELSISAKPTAYFHQWGIALRFMVPGDPRYVYCSCGDSLGDPTEPRLCSHVPLAVWGFRSLKAQTLKAQIASQVNPTNPRIAPGETHAQTGLVSTQPFEPIAPELLQAIDEGIQQLLRVGVAGLNSAVRGMIQRLEKDCREGGLVWLGEIWAEVLQQQDYYHQHNAQFQAATFTDLLMEVELRYRALQSPSCPVPQLWIRGSPSDRVTDLGATTLVGLGCSASVTTGQVLLKVFFQDTKSGTVLRVSRGFTDPADLLKPFSQLALTSGFKRFSLGNLGRSQVITKGGKRSPNHEFRPGRATASLNPQNFSWENLRPPLLVEDFQVLQDHLAQLPPAALRPRRVGDRFWVIAVAQVTGVSFSPVDQWVTAELFDAQGCSLQLNHPYHDRAAEGTEVLLHLLQQYPDRLRFVAGEIRWSSHSRSPSLILHPTALVFETPAGQRHLCQPWIDTRHSLAAFSPFAGAYQPIALPELPQTIAHSSHSPEEVVQHYLDRVKASVTDLLLLGLETIDRRLMQQWQDRWTEGQSLGFNSFLLPIQTIAQELNQKAEDLHWQPDKITIALRQLWVQLALAQVAQTRT